MRRAEEYLVQVLQNGSTCKTMDQLRCWVYYNRKKRLLTDLPPTSGKISGHIERSYYATVMLTQLCRVDSAPVDPRNYGYDSHEDDILWPTIMEMELPTLFTLTCTYKGCKTKRCSCQIVGLACSQFCKYVITENRFCSKIFC